MEELQRERKQIEGLLSCLPKVSEQMEGRVRLNIGGSKFESTSATLNKSQWFAALLSGRFALAVDAEGYIFIDRDGKHFRWILNYLRMGKSVMNGLALTDDQRRQLIEETEYYQLDEFSSLLAVPAVGQRALFRISSKRLASLGVTQVLLHEYKTFTGMNYHTCKHVPGRCNCYRCETQRTENPCKCNEEGFLAPHWCTVSRYNHNAGQPKWTVNFLGHSLEMGRDDLKHEPPKHEVTESVEALINKIVKEKIEAARDSDS